MSFLSGAFFSTGFIVNDPEHAPGGATWLRGITPMRLAAVAVVSFLMAANGARGRFSVVGFAPEAFELLLVRTFEILVAAFPFMIAVVQAEIRTRRWTLSLRLAGLALAVIGGSALYSLVLEFMRTSFSDTAQVWSSILADGSAPSYSLLSPWEEHRSMFFRALLPGSLLAMALYLATRELDAERRAQEIRVATVEIDRQIAEARLQVLQSQIEPHFLFNTLASVKLLYEQDPGDGRALLRNLREYLDAAGTAGRLRETTLAAEAALANAFLSIFRLRMGDRLQATVDIPRELEGARVPPLMIGTLLENAIKHGISPRATGGRIDISARRFGDTLEVKVVDDGVGLRDEAGTGVGLANTRERLQSFFGAEGSLSVDTTAGGGVTATLVLPYRR